VKAITRRLRRLEDQSGPADGTAQHLLVACAAALKLAEDTTEFLRENAADICGFRAVPTA